MAQPPMPAQGAPARQPGDASKLISSIHDQMMQVMDMLQGSPSIEDDDKAALAQIIKSYESFVESLGQAPGAKKEAPMPAGGVTTPEAGAAKVQPAM